MPLSENKQRWLAAHPELGRHQSMKRRHDRHDYQSPCIYMITLSIKGRRPLLGAVCSPDDNHTQPWFLPSPLGERIEITCTPSSRPPNGSRATWAT